ncbi:lantibiotic dehydratase [Streptomyces sp. CAU 1734]|uniref:lantibiotic dehydratase n=1 Tax=Streptomyces sp. CAU 1734 TaxID=3140360 RepID=UPI0032618787
MTTLAPLHHAAPAAAGTRGDTGVPAARTAPYALVRATLTDHPAQTPDGAAFRAELRRLTEVETLLAALRPGLGDALYASREGHGAGFHREVVLPLRRALHNGRPVRPALVERLGELPARVPGLGIWLELDRRRSAALARLAERAEGALRAERRALAEICRDPSLRLAISLTSPDLLRAVDRAGAGNGGGRARKEEPGVLRHALRSCTRTSPLSYFTAVGWGPLDGGPEGAGAPPGPAGVRAVVRTSQTLVGAVWEALLAEPGRRASPAYRMCSTARRAPERVELARIRPVFTGGRFTGAREDEAAVAGGPAGAALLRVAAACERPATLDELAGVLAGPGGRAAAARFLEQLVDAGLLVPAAPVDPQDPDPLPGLAGWLRGPAALPGDEVLAGRIEEIARMTAEFAGADPVRRTVLLAGLRERWEAVLAAVGVPVPGGAGPLTVLTEDVVARRPLALAGAFGEADLRALAEVSAVAEVFDPGHLVRRVVRDRFVGRYGPGGVCRHLWEFGPEAAEAWLEAFRGPEGARGAGGLPVSGAAEVAGLRAGLAAAVRGGDDPDEDAVLSAEAVAGLGRRLPPWMSGRPLSYAHFVQRDPGGLLVLNHVYGGWGRFSSRFLDALDPAAARGIAREIGRVREPGARAAQVRPVSGFNANLHPLFVADEIGPDRSRSAIGEADVELVHDEASDQVRIRLRATGELMDVFYAGLLAPMMLPRRAAALPADHPHGGADFGALVPEWVTDVPGGPLVRTPRLRYGRVVLRRRRWRLAAGTVGALRADLAAGGEVPVAAVARWRALLGLPDQVFVHPVAGGVRESAAQELLYQVARPKPHFADLGNALHLRCLGKWLARHPDGVMLEEALPAPGGRDVPVQAAEFVVETYRAGRRP